MLTLLLQVKLWYQVEELYKYQEVTCELEGGMSAEDVFTHASFASDVGNYLKCPSHIPANCCRFDYCPGGIHGIPKASSIPHFHKLEQQSTTIVPNSKRRNNARPEIASR